MVLLNLVNCLYTICNLFWHHKKLFQYLNSNEPVYTIAFTQVTLTTILTEQNYPIAVHYYRYLIYQY